MIQQIQEASEPIKQAVDILSAGTVIASLMAWVPPLAALLSLIWGGMRIYESYLNIKKLKEGK